MPKPWQVSAMIDTIHEKKNVIISTSTRYGKSPSYQLISFIKVETIVLMILPTTVFMTDQVYLLIITFLMQVIDANYCSVNYY